VLARLDTPDRIQAFLDRTPYSTDKTYRCPRSVLRDRRAHCFDGAVVAAAAFAHHGVDARLLDLRSVRDDDHVLCVYRREGAYGCVGKSNFVGLRGREPIYRTLRELALSYFELYFNMQREKSLRSVSVLVDVSGFDGWRTRDRTMATIAGALDRAKHTPLLTPSQLRALRPVDRLTFKANQLGTDPKGVYWG